MSRVLIADDDAEVRAVLVEYLRLRGFEVLEAANGLEALLQIKRHRPAAVVLDLGMPRLGGLEALTRIRAFDPGLTAIVLTADLDPAIHRRALDLGATVVLTKPAHLGDIAAAIERRAAASAPAGAAPYPAPPAPSISPPLRQAARTAVTEPRAEAATRERGRILVVDDDAPVRDMLAELLRVRGYEVRVAPDAPTAIGEIGAAVLDVVLLDITMPGLSGVEALPVIRAIAPTVSVIVISGMLDADVARSALARGAFDYVMKPVDSAYLERSIEAVLALRGVL